MLHRHPLLGLATALYLGFVAWLTLTPQPIDADRQALIVRGLAALHRRGVPTSFDYDRLEFVANIALFVPVGMFAVLLLGVRWWWVAALGCLALTIGIENAQRAIPGRVPDPRDVVANGLGGVIGIAMAVVLTAPGELRARRRKRARAHARATRP